MIKRNYDKIKKQLEDKRKQLAAGIDHITNDNLKLSQRDASGDLSGYTFHMADVATDNFDREFSLDIASTEQKLLNRIDEALKKIEEGTYGHCELCGVPISMERLKAVPYARLCIKCKQEEEKKNQTRSTS
ncbi:MAG: TraR/DksA family transcriptional regulator [Candidatus Omnitrophica bacterium]|nr:TraR/DksA family transcriptional regulator [Candidatus Omnitrophota bacterium]